MALRWGECRCEGKAEKNIAKPLWAGSAIPDMIPAREAVGNATHFKQQHNGVGLFVSTGHFAVVNETVPDSE